MSTVTFQQASTNFGIICDEVISSREAVLIKRRGRPAVALMAADELTSLIETAHLLRSPKNARRLLGALKRARAGKGVEMTLAELRKNSGVE
jgi:antitoxin YefM